MRRRYPHHLLDAGEIPLLPGTLVEMML